MSEDVFVRRAGTADDRALMRLAALDSAALPSGGVLVAEVDGAIAAAVGLDDGHAIADPFRRSAHLVGLLRFHAATFGGR